MLLTDARLVIYLADRMAACQLPSAWGRAAPPLLRTSQLADLAALPRLVDRAVSCLTHAQRSADTAVWS